ncbi:MAG: hypothetical protein SOX56_09670 [[Pasteurella] mairii]|uniref:Uncharacterized protein n=1 Tax=[Pasteurella] mairii TaxID=757 RepID=A0A379B7I6_9PAST|nr:hypothetical protein [[Pasteurella] mairii]SUB34442.1 Uncharacterised protein [[Pasteurella] mairii]
MRETQTEPQSLAVFEQEILSSFENSLTEEQRFLQGILSGKIKTYSHEEVVADLRKALR